jgi:hypothetical protein
MNDSRPLDLALKLESLGDLQRIGAHRELLNESALCIRFLHDLLITALVDRLQGMEIKPERLNS